MAQENGKVIFPPFYQADEEFVDEGDVEYPFEEITGSGDENRIRGNWTSSMDYYLSAFGFTFAVGNLWRFPCQCHLHGGLAYLIPYIIFFLFAATPVMLMELSLGQFISLGPISVWKVSPLFKGIGLAMLFVSAISAVYFQMIASWSLMYVLNSLKFALPWATCGNSWNTEGAVENCRLMNGTIAANGTCSFGVQVDKNGTSAELSAFPKNHVVPSLEYFHNEVLQLSSGIADVQTGTFNWQLAICLLIAWSAVFLCSFKGIKTSGKVVYLTVVVPYIILFVLSVRFLTLPGAADGLWFFLKPDFNVLYSFRVWGDAAVQVFYSLAVCTGGLTLLSSYNRFHNNVFRDLWLIGFVDLIASLLVSTVVFAAIGFVCHEMDILLTEFRLQDGVQLVFVFFAEAVSKLPVAPLYALMFFLMTALVVFNTELFLVETIVSSICDEYPERLRKNHRHVMTVVVIIFFVLGVPFCSGAGLYWVVLLDEFVPSWPLIVIAFFEVTVICWIYGADNFLDNIRWMTSYYPPVYILWKVLWKFVCPLVFLLILTCVWMVYRPPSYDGVVFPFWSSIVGWALATTPAVIILVTGLVVLCQTNGSLAERWQQLLCPEDSWGPALAVHRAEYYPLQIPEARRLVSPSQFTPNFKRPSSPPVATKNRTPMEPQRAYSKAPDDRETVI